MRDSDVVASIVAGEPGGLAEAYDRYADSLYKYCRTLLRDPADAADAVQDTFVIAASRLERLHAPERLRAWLYTAARNECLRVVAAGKSTPELDEAPAGSADVSGAAGRADLRALFDDAKNGLNPREREAIELQLSAGLAAGEVADVLGVSADHAHTLLSRAREQLETSLGVLLVSRGRRDHCRELGAMLGGWDGRLTVLLRKRLHRHIAHCKKCTAKRASQLHRTLHDQSTGAALTTGAALSFRAAAGVPEGLREHTLALATGQGPTAAAHGAAVLGRAGEFTKAGFPKPAANPGLAAQHGARLAVREAADGLKTGLMKTAVRPSPQGQAAVTAAGVVAVTVAVAAFAMTGNSQRLTATADPSTPAAFAPVLSFAPNATSASQQPQTTAVAPRKPAPAKSKAAPTAASAPPAAPPVPPPVQPSAPVKESTPHSHAPSHAHSHAPAPRHSHRPAPSPHPTPAPPGTLSAFPAGGTLVVEPGAGAQITLSASGGEVNWSVTVGGDPDGAVSVSPASGTLTPGDPSAAVTVTVSQYLDCGWGSPNACPTITVSPSGAAYNIWTGPAPQPHGHHHHGHHGFNSNSAAAAALTETTQLYLTETRRISVNQTGS